MTYSPAPHPATWAPGAPNKSALDLGALAAAARHAGERETPWRRDLAAMVTSDFAKGIKAFKAGMKEEDEAETPASPAQVPPPGAATASAAPAASVVDRTREPAKSL